MSQLMFFMLMFSTVTVILLFICDDDDTTCSFMKRICIIWSLYIGPLLIKLICYYSYILLFIGLSFIVTYKLRKV